MGSASAGGVKVTTDDAQGDHDDVRPAPPESAALAGLRYVSDEQPGIRRLRHGRGLRYLRPDGRPVQDAATRRRIQTLAIPPAWTDVWICPDPLGHLQATGRDARGRKQYRYHARWTQVRDAAKYDHLVAFAEALPRIRERLEADLRQPGIPYTKVLAAVVKLLEATSIRIGNDEYRRTNRSFGLTTLLDRHARFDGGQARFEFRGKSGVKHCVALNDRRLARIVKQCQEVPGQELFQYIDNDGGRHAVESSDVNAYLRDVSGGDFTAKDFRTWNGTVLALRELRVCEAPTSATAGKRQVSTAIKRVAAELGNTPAVCRKAYIHPAVLTAYLASALPTEGTAAPTAERGLSDEEACVLGLLRQASDAARAAA